MLVHVPLPCYECVYQGLKSIKKEEKGMITIRDKPYCTLSGEILEDDTQFRNCKRYTRRETQ